MIFPNRRRSRALSKANIKHDLRRGSRTPSRGDILLNVNETVTDHRHVSRSPKSPRGTHERDGDHKQRHVSRSPKSPRERNENGGDQRHFSGSPKSPREGHEIGGDHREDNLKV